MAKYSKCSCEHCGAHIEFPDDAAGATVACPHCQGQTTLSTGQLQPERAAKMPAEGGRHFGRIAAIMVIVLVAGSLGGWAALKMLSAAKAPQRTEPGDGHTSATFSNHLRRHIAFNLRLERQSQRPGL